MERVWRTGEACYQKANGWAEKAGFDPMAQDILKQGALPPFHLKMFFFWFLTCGFVLIEPAPFDLLFPLVALVFLSGNRIVLPRKSYVLFPSLLLFVAANVLSVLAAQDVARAFSFAAITVYMFVFSSFIAVAVSNYGYPLIDRIMKAYLVVALFSALIGLLAIARLLPAQLVEMVTSYEATRARAFFKDPNVYAPFLMVALVYAVDLFFLDKKKRLFWGGGVFLLMLGILVGFSRAAWGVSLCALVIYFVLSAIAERRFSRLWNYMIYFVALLLLGGALLTVFAKEANIAHFIDQRLTLQAYDKDRFEVQRAAIGAGLLSVVGIGPGQSENAFVELVSRGQMTGATHSLYVRVIAETGILGALSFFALLFVTASKALRICVKGDPAFRRSNCVYAACFFATLINSLVIDSLHWRHFFLVIGIVWGLDILGLAKTDEKREVV